MGVGDTEEKIYGKVTHKGHHARGVVVGDSRIIVEKEGDSRGQVRGKIEM